MNNNEKYFYWFGKPSYGEMEPFGPYFSQWKKYMGDKSFHSLEEMLKGNLSDTKIKALKKARFGTIVDMSSFCANERLVVKCMSLENAQKIGNLISQITKYEINLGKLKKQLSKEIE